VENEEIAQKFATLETKMENVEKFMEDIMNNHLKTIYRKLSTYLPRWVTMIITVLTSIVVGFIVWSVR